MLALLIFTSLLQKAIEGRIGASGKKRRHETLYRLVPVSQILSLARTRLNQRTKHGVMCQDAGRNNVRRKYRSHGVALVTES